MCKGGCDLSANQWIVDFGIAVNSAQVKALEKVCADLVTGAKAKDNQRGTGGTVRSSQVARCWPSENWSAITAKESQYGPILKYGHCHVSH